jgi:uncharacterized protein
VAAFGPDFRQARRGKQFTAVSAESLGSALGFFFIFLLLQQILLAMPTLLDAFSTASGRQLFDNKSAVFLWTLALMVPVGLVVSWLIYRTSLRRGGPLLMPELLRFPKLGWAGWLIVLVGFVVLMGLLAATLRFFSGDLHTTGEVERQTAGLPKTSLALFIVPLAVGIGAPLVEEFLFRGPLFVRLRQTAIGDLGTLVLTSGIWAAIHVGQPTINVITLFLMGLALGTLLLRFGSIWVPIACHCVWNTIASAALLNADKLQNIAQ